MNASKKSSSRILGMTYIQITFLVLLAGCAILSIGGLFFFALYGNRPQPIAIIPTPSKIAATLTKVPTGTPIKKATPTRTITPIRKPAPTITYPPAVTYKGNPIDYIPTENELPNGYILNTSASGSIDGEQYSSFTKAYTNDYPNQNRTEDPYIVIYQVVIYTKEIYATNSFESMTEKWIADNVKNWVNIDSTISPHQVQFPNNLTSINNLAAYFDTFPGQSIPGAFVFVKAQSHNIVITVKTLSHYPNGNQNKAISNAYYFTSLIAQKLK